MAKNRLSRLHRAIPSAFLDKHIPDWPGIVLKSCCKDNGEAVIIPIFYCALFAPEQELLP